MQMTREGSWLALWKRSEDAEENGACPGTAKHEHVGDRYAWVNCHNAREPHHIHAITVVIFPPHPLDQPCCIRLLY